MNITITKFLASVLVILLHQSVGQEWVEEVDKDGTPLNMDIYFDRTVMVTNNAKRCLQPILEDQKVLPDHQFGFRAHHGTTEQIHRVAHTIRRQTMERKEYCSAVFLDVQQAFDRVWHKDLLYKLKFCLPNTAYMLLKSYLEDRLFQIICTGVLIDDNRVLTSYTPLRRYLKNSTMGDIGITILNERIRKDDTNTFLSFGHYVENIECYKRVKDLAESELTSEQWHGFRNEHSPVHDLYILKFKDFGLKLLDPNPKHYSFDYIGSKQRTRAGPMITILAQRKDALESGMKFASLGYKDERHVRSRLRSYEYPYGTNAEVDCDEWMIRDWGRFICLKNYENFLGIQSGALLIHKEKLYGIGCFTLKKGNESIYVFTDIRTYRKEIFNTCGKPPANDTDIYKLQMDPNEEEEDNVTTTTPRPLLHLGRRYYDDWF